MRILHRASLPTLLGATVLAFAGSVIALDDTSLAAPAAEASVAAPPAAQAAMPEPATTPAERFAALDIDADGSLSRAEAEASPALRDRFDEADTDASGALSQAEYAALVSGGSPETEVEPEAEG
jgi:hypothetical protein